ncbi:hypothetical protein N2152v2_004182 [Parachlorella kessleri]
MTPSNRAQIRGAPVDKADLSTSLESLDALLTTDEDTQQQQAPSRLPRNATRRVSMGGEEWSGRSVLDEFTRGTAMNLAVGERQQLGTGLRAQLPSFEPLCSYLIAAWTLVATASTQLLPSTFPPEATIMYSSMMAAQGELHQLVTANFVAASWANMGAGALLLASAGAAAERVMGRLRFSAIYLLSGVTGTVWYFALSNSTDPAALHCGNAAGLVGVSSAIAVVCTKNRRLLTLPQLLGMAGAAAVAAVGAVAADAVLWWDHTFMPGAYLAAAVSGVALGAACSPRYEVLREVIIPDGSVEVPEDAPEYEVVVDRTTSVQQWGACIGYGLCLGLFTLALTSGFPAASLFTLGTAGLPPADSLAAAASATGAGAGGELTSAAASSGNAEKDLVDNLVQYLRSGGPEAAQYVYGVAPDAWPLKI